MRAAVLTIGDEIVDGTITETNSQIIAERLAMIGLPIDMKMSVRDNKADIKSALQYLCKQIGCETDDYGIIITTGGLGPTADDLTRESVTELFDEELVFNADIYETIKAKFRKVNIDVPDENKKQAYIIDNSIVLDNPIGTAPGFIYESKINLAVASFPGVPRELKKMLLKLLAYIDRNFRVGKIGNMITANTIGMPESRVDAEIGKILQKDNSNISYGTIANLGRVDLRFTLAKEYKHKARQKVEEIIKSTSLIARKTFSYQNESIEEVIVQLLRERKQTISFAESCTGGLLAKTITDVAGSSQIFPGSVVVYSNEQKTRLLDVSPDILEKHGAVSFETVFAMTEGLKTTFDVDYAISVSGIAGPDGGTDTKPVGTIFIGFASPTQNIAMHFVFPDSERDSIRQRTLYKTMELLWESLKHCTIDLDNIIMLEAYRENRSQ